MSFYRLLGYEPFCHLDLSTPSLPIFFLGWAYLIAFCYQFNLVWAYLIVFYYQLNFLRSCSQIRINESVHTIHQEQCNIDYIKWMMPPLSKLFKMTVARHFYSPACLMILRARLLVYSNLEIITHYLETNCTWRTSSPQPL